MRNRKRYIPPGGALVAISHRCLQARLLLTPTRRLNQLALGVLAKAIERSNARFVAIVILGNHLHLLLWVEDALQMATCMEYFAGNLAREAGRLRGWKGKFWHGQYSAIVVAEDEASQVSVLRYFLEHGCKENLVASPFEWPGLHPAAMLLGPEDPRGTWVDRTALHLARLREPHRKRCEADFEETLPLRRHALPCWAHLSAEDIRQRIQDLVVDIEHSTRERHLSAGTRPLGPRRVIRQNPRERPKSSKKSPAPLIHASSKAIRERFRRAYRSVMAAYALASARLRNGDRAVEFPRGTFPPALPFVPHAEAPRAG
ncbi:MAG: transposase [Acidobacteria bacterium]|nr:transposase [Acidobacteriota bacterium]